MGKLLLKDCKRIFTVRESVKDEIETLENYSIFIENEKIVKIGKFEEVTTLIDDETKIIDCSQNAVLPGFVDPHTHLVFGGDRKAEYIAKMKTKDPQELSDIVGATGMDSTMKQTKEAGYDGLFKSSVEKLNRLLVQGITTVEIKSGYGIDKEVELTELEVIRDLKKTVPQTIVATYLGGHDINKEMGKEKYIEFMIDEMLPIIEKEKLAERIDIWIEDGLYNYEETKRLIIAAKEHGLRATLHTNEFSDIGGGRLAAEMKIDSADHLNYLPDDELKMMAEAGVVGTVLAGTDYSINHAKPANGRHFIDNGLTVALATNLNPGNYTLSLQFIMDLACNRHGFTPDEALRATTINAAKALKLDKEYGSIEEGKYADIQIWNTDDFKDAIYKHGFNFVKTVIKHGKVVVEDGLIK